MDGKEQTCDPMEGSSAEICDGLDNECDGMTDEDELGNSLTQVCYTGPYGTLDIGICKAGVQTYTNSIWSDDCVGEVTPNDEILDGKYNDCDGAVDEFGEDCIFTAEIKATGQAYDKSTVKIGIDPNGKTYPYPSLPPDYTIVLKIAGGENGFTEDIRVPGYEREEWELNIIVSGPQFNGASDPNKPGFFPVLSWDTNALCPPGPDTGYFRLYSEDWTMLIEDMTLISQYKTRETYVVCSGNITCTFTYYIVWSKDFCFEMNLPRGWSMISLPVLPENATLSAVFPDAKVVYGYKKGLGYFRVKGNDTLQVGKGYWILFNEEHNYTLCRQKIPEYTLNVQSGWSMIGSCSFPAKATLDVGNIVVIYNYAQEFGYKRVPETEYLEPGEGYWMLVTDLCQLKVAQLAFKAPPEVRYLMEDTITYFSVPANSQLDITYEHIGQYGNAYFKIYNRDGDLHNEIIFDPNEKCGTKNIFFSQEGTYKMVAFGKIFRYNLKFFGDPYDWRFVIAALPHKNVFRITDQDEVSVNFKVTKDDLICYFTQESYDINNNNEAGAIIYLPDGSQAHNNLSLPFIKISKWECFNALWLICKFICMKSKLIPGGGF